jgi:nucleoside-diphosphate-sugar epimerase
LKVLVIGGTKFIGRSVADVSKSKGHQVTLFNRGKTDLNSVVPTIVGDVEEILKFKEQILREKFDVAVHCISYTEKHADDLVSLFANTDTHVIVLSSGDSYEAFQGLNRMIDKAELPVTEDSPLSSMKYYWSDSAIKGSLAQKYDKNLMTEIVMTASKDKKIKATVFRLSMIYGPGDSQYPARHGPFIRRIIDKRKDLVLSDREQCQVYTYGYIENVSAAIVHSFNLNQTCGKIYNLGELKSRSRRRWAEAYANAGNWEFRFHILPEELIRNDKSFRNAPPQHLLTDSSLFCRETNFIYPVSLKDAIKRTLDFALEHPKVLGESEDYKAEDRLLESYYSKLDQIHSEMKSYS